MNKLLISTLLIIIASCSSPEKKAKLVVTRPAVDLATIRFDSTYNIRYTLVNTGNKELVVDTVSASCGCTIPESTKFRIKPADSASLLITFKPVDSGAFDKKLVIKSNTDSTFTVVSFYGTIQK